MAAEVRYAARRKPLGTLNAMPDTTTTMCDLEREGEQRGDMRGAMGDPRRKPSTWI
jgi:hypothetical protein